MPLSAFAKGNGNIDGGGGGMGNGTSQNYWNSGNDGVRVTIVRATDRVAVSTPIDYTNKSPASSIISFGKKSKVHYRNGSMLTPKVGGYSYKSPKQDLPRIVSSNGNVNIDAIKRYFCSEYAIMMIANDTGIKYDNLISGNYKLLLEPIAYFTFQGAKYGMTATEAALYDQQLSGGLRSKMVSLSHKNLPLAMFLETPDLGYPAWSGSTTSPASNAKIISSLGLGIVRFSENTGEPPTSSYDYEYRVNTDVITSVTVTSSRRITPAAPASVTFKVNGGTYTVTNIVIPEGESQLVWFKWRTPSSPQTVTINVSSSGGNLYKAVLRAKIVNLGEKVPPNPTANDRKDDFSLPNIPNNMQKSSASWGIWSSYWKADWKWVSVWKWCSHRSWVSDGKGRGHWRYWGHWVDNGYWKDYGDWKYKWTGYSASLSASKAVSPDAKVPTESGITMKSGYGISVDVSANLSSSAPNSHITGAQNVVAYFPEFNYQGYWRLLDRVTSGYSSQFKLKQNKYSTYNQRVHFTPVWFPNGRYTVYSKVIDAWTPAGMLSMNLTDYVNINGSVFDDWHIAPKK